MADHGEWLIMANGWSWQMTGHGEWLVMAAISKNTLDNLQLFVYIKNAGFIDSIIFRKS